MTDPRLTALAAALPATVPFVGPEEAERRRGAPFLARLGANESAFGPSPGAIDAMRRAAPDIWKYGDASSYDLQHALAAHHGCAPEEVLVGEGIDGLLGNLVRLTVTVGDTAVMSRGSYPTFAYHVTGFGGVVETVPYRDDRADLGALIDRATQTGARLVYLANPDNPMGGHLAGREIAEALDSLPPRALLVLDEAYADFAPADFATEVPISDPRLIRMRTFSKAHGMAGARIGYALGAAVLIAAFDRVRNHFGVNRIAQAGALAALADRDWLAATVDRTARARDRLADIARANGLAPLPSATNFVTMDCGGDGALARALVAALGKRGIFVRMPFAAPQDRCIRVTCAPDEDLDRFADILPQALAAARTTTAPA